MINDKEYDVKKYIEEMIFSNYYIILIIEDLITYFDFFIYSDHANNDIRTILMKNLNSDENISIKSCIVSYLNDNYIQYNEIDYFDKTNTSYVYKYYGNCHRTKKNYIK